MPKFVEYSGSLPTKITWLVLIAAKQDLYYENCGVDRIVALMIVIFQVTAAIMYIFEEFGTH